MIFGQHSVILSYLRAFLNSTSPRLKKKLTRLLCILFTISLLRLLLRRSLRRMCMSEIITNNRIGSVLEMTIQTPPPFKMVQKISQKQKLCSIFYEDFLISRKFPIGSVGRQRLEGRTPRLKQARGPSAATRVGQGAERCGYRTGKGDRNSILEIPFCLS